MKTEHNDPQYTAFIQTTVSSQNVYTLQDHEDFYAECPSEAYDNELGEPEAVYCFWHTAEDAAACRQEEWADYTLNTLSLADFMYEVLIEMDNHHTLVGVSFDAKLVGVEVEPIELLGDLLDEIQKRGLTEEFPDFDELQQYRAEWEKMAWQQQIVH